VREAHGKCFVPSLHRGDPPHSPEELHIGQHNENKTAKRNKCTDVKKPNYPKVV